MIVRYEQDLAPYFERIRAAKGARGVPSRGWLRGGWAGLLSLLRPASRRG